MIIPENSSKQLVPGTLCWTRRPLTVKLVPTNKDSSVKLLEGRDDSNSQGNKILDTLWWPSLIYPTWSKAANSGLMDSAIDKGVLIQGCRKKISIDHLKRNTVPLKVAINQTSNKNPDKNGDGIPKKKIVVYYLGLDLQRSSIASWGAVIQEEVILYSKNALTILHMYKDKIHRHDWHSFIIAMDEASVVAENSYIDPVNLLLKLEEAERKINQQAEQQHTATPEFFDDWKTLSRGDSQSQSQSQSQKFTQFSQVKSSSLSQHDAVMIESEKKLAPILIRTEDMNEGGGDTNGVVLSDVLIKTTTKSVQFVDDQVSISDGKSCDDSRSVGTTGTEALVLDDFLLTQE